MEGSSHVRGNLIPTIADFDRILNHYYDFEIQKHRQGIAQQVRMYVFCGTIEAGMVRSISSTILAVGF